jgi:hypothetical protein
VSTRREMRKLVPVPVRRFYQRHRVLVRAGLWMLMLVVVGFAGFSGLKLLSVPVAWARAGTDKPPAPPIAKQVREKVKITVQTIPPVKAEVRWGKKKLGVLNTGKKPFFIERFKDSGPIDVTVRAEGFLPVHTRAYTFETNKITVKLTPLTEKHTLFGFKQVPDGGVDGGAADAGAPAGPVPMGPAPPPPMGPAPPPPVGPSPPTPPTN